MPFFKNAAEVICQVYDTEVKPLVEAGWKELTADEEAAYRELLRVEHHLTSAVEIEAARVKAGIHEVLAKVVPVAEADAQDVAATAKEAVDEVANETADAPADNAESTDEGAKGAEGDQ